MRVDDGCSASSGAASGSESARSSSTVEALMGEPRRGRDEIGERELARAVLAPGQLQPGDRAGHADREPAEARLERVGLAVGVEKDVLGGQRRRALAIVDGDVSCSDRRDGSA